MSLRSKLYDFANDNLRAVAYFGAWAVGKIGRDRLIAAGIGFVAGMVALALIS